jgi:LPS O-antigen subunit length determinant protein (WzzB/FepE family)
VESYVNANGSRRGPLEGHANGRAFYAPDDSEYAAVELFRYGALLWQHRWLVIGVPLAIALAAGLFAKFAMTKVWRAQTIATPVSATENAQNEVGGSLDALGGMGGLSALLGFAGQSNNAIVAERYMAIMKSFAFTMSLVERYHLDRPILAEEHEDPAKITQWKLYKLIQSRFQCEYDYKSGNLTLYFMDQDRDEATRILGFYLQNLRDKLRNGEVQSASEASVSLQDEIKKTSDSLLQNQLYELMARQIQRQKLAQVQADFAFKVIEPPVVPDVYYSPSARAYFMLSGSISLFLVCMFLVLREWSATVKAHLTANKLSEQQSPADQSGAEDAFSNGEARSSR